MRVVGSLEGVAFLPPGSSVADATIALRADLIRGLGTRCTLLADSLVDGDGDDGEAMWSDAAVAPTTLPARVHVALSGPITVSGYMFPDDEVTDAAELLAEIFSKPVVAAAVTANEGFANTTCALPSTKDEVVRKGGSGDGGGGVKGAPASNGTGVAVTAADSGGALKVVLAVAIAVLAVAVGMLVFK
jgi:hypothetical protein